MVVITGAMQRICEISVSVETDTWMTLKEEIEMNFGISKNAFMKENRIKKDKRELYFCYEGEGTIDF
ncbi:hypothetical protein [Anaerocolumna jejuensis]|uniref:hypothetical protein n=1 Tax=Anaerocolumna jejuensis TaxID=259063 RepID=UPI003F7C0A48